MAGLEAEACAGGRHAERYDHGRLLGLGGWGYGWGVRLGLGLGLELGLG